ncbi:MAG: hypothetical protein Tsb005_19340 [Gammaproteobacteria bacterium]
MIKKLTPRKNNVWRLFVLLSYALFVSSPYASNQETTRLTIQDAVAQAWLLAPELRAARAQEQQHQELAIAESQLSDPSLTLGVANVPVNSFSLNQEQMTQGIIGLQQVLPKGQSLAIKSKIQTSLAAAEGANWRAQRNMIQLQVRQTWLELYYWLQAKRIVAKNKRLFAHLVRVTESLLAAGKQKQPDVLSAKLELTNLENKQIMIDQEIAMQRAKLARWVGQRAASQALASQLPTWQVITNPDKQLQLLAHQPKLQADEAMVQASQQGVRLADQQYKPGYTLGVNYGVRQSRNRDGSHRPDFISAQVKIDLPIFTAKRQTKQLQASFHQLETTQEQRLRDYRELREQLTLAQVTHQQLLRQINLYKRHLLPEAEQYAQASLNAYENDQVDFPALARAYVNDLDAQLAHLRLVINLKQTQAMLLYLTSSSSSS